MNQEIKHIPVKSIRPDPKQPRRWINEAHVAELAVSIKNEGVINPIEIDEDYTIITGEMRWRASKKAGLKTIPAKIITGEKAQGMERFIRQMQENIHHNTMAPLDMAQGLKKVQTHLTNSAATLENRDAKHKGARYQTYTKELSALFGISHSAASGYLKLLEEPTEIREILAKANPDDRQGFSLTVFATIRNSPEPYQNALKKKLLKERIPREAMRFLVDKVRQLHADENHKLIQILLKKNVSGLNSEEAIQELSRTSEGISFLKGDAEAAKAIREHMETFSRILKERPLSTFAPLYRVTLLTGVKAFIGELVEYAEEEEKRINIKQLISKRE